MFSVDDPIMLHNWTVSLKHQIDIVNAGLQVQVANTSSLYRAAEQVAFRVPSKSSQVGASRKNSSTPGY
jgi:hypothetical protein